MITKEKHFTKCETPNSSRIIEDKKHSARIPNGIVDPNKVIKTQPDVVKQEKLDENKPATEQTKPNGIVEDKTDASEDNISYNAPKFGTVIPNRIFVGGFSAKTADEELWRFFSSFSHITAAKIIYDRAGVSKCYGFVTFANPKDAKAIVKQYGGVMFSPMGRLRIAQAVRKQVPQFSPELSPVMAGEPYYMPPPKGPLCIAAYPIPPSQMPVQQSTMGTQPMNHHSSPRGSSATTPESGVVAAPPPQQAGGARFIAQRPPHQQPPLQQGQGMVYQSGGMVAPQYMMPMAYQQSMPGYDATGLYTTCPGYAQAMAPGYPYVVLQPAPRDYTAYHGALAPALAYGPPPGPTACYMPDAKMPVMNPYIY